MQSLSRVSGLLPAAALALSLACIAPAFAESYSYIATPAVGGENFSTLTGTAEGSGTWYTLYCVDVGTLQMNDILVVAGESQIQQPSATTAILLSAQLSRTSTPCADIAAAGFVYPGGTDVAAANGYNVTVNEYRGVSPKTANITIPLGGTDAHYLVYNVHASADMAVPANTGGLQVLRIRPDS